jgi:antitoxin (DNA-binding transcriptional repressor) of toxin-antitoxin stability system
MPSISLQEAQARLPEVIAELLPGEELRLLHDGRTIVTLVKTCVPSPIPRQTSPRTKMTPASF